MRRRLFNIGSAVSLLLCVATAALWVRSYRHGDTLLKYAALEAFSISSGRGGICYEHTTMQWAFKSTPWRWRSDKRPLDPRKLTKHWWHGFGYRSIAIDKGWDRTYVTPHWSLVAIAAVSPAISAFWLLNRRRPSGTCPCCSYDLTGNTSGVCPECGTPVPANPEAAG